MARQKDELNGKHRSLTDTNKHFRILCA